ncbi:TPA: hypothetical protein LTW68_001678 [Enterobacter hormaechei]|nr:hypothetical protein [Enterobacter hormaechei]
MALIIFSFLPETPKSSLCVTFGYMTILNFQYNQLDMLYFAILLHHWRVGVKILKCAHKILVSMFLNFNELYFFVVWLHIRSLELMNPAFHSSMYGDHDNEVCMAGKQQERALSVKCVPHSILVANPALKVLSRCTALIHAYIAFSVRYSLLRSSRG